MIEVYRFSVMTTPCELRFYNTPKAKCDACASDILKEAKRLEKKYNYFDPNSYLSKLNHRQSRAIDSETKMLLQKAKVYATTTEGIFDITIATIKESYNLQQLSHLQEQISRLQEYIGTENFQIKRNKISFSNPFTKIDLGGMVKEYAVDRAVVITKKYTIKSALINFGGDIYALGRKPNKEAFQIGIKNPKNPKEELFYIQLSDMALTTSASYERKKLIEDQTFSHIISPKKYSTRPLSATVIAPTALESGIYSTALMIDKTLPIKEKKYIILENLTIVS